MDTISECLILTYTAFELISERESNAQVDIFQDVSENVIIMLIRFIKASATLKMQTNFSHSGHLSNCTFRGMSMFCACFLNGTTLFDLFHFCDTLN